MSTKIVTTTLAAIACAAVVSAQAPPPIQAPPPSAPPAAQRPPDTRANDNLTVTGCVERSASAAIASPEAGGNAVEASKFILTKVMKPTGTAGSSSAAPAPPSYRLDADDSKLSDHVGQKVEIKGKLADRSASSNAIRGGSNSDAPQLKVDSVKMIAATCSE